MSDHKKFLFLKDLPGKVVHFTTHFRFTFFVYFVTDFDLIFKSRGEWVGSRGIWVSSG